MKIRTRLVLAFFIIIFVPTIIVFATYILLGVSNFTTETMIRFKENFEGMSADTIVSVALILLLTATMLIVWIYKGIVPNITKLTKAADHIKDGDLEFNIESDGVDELSKLCNTFEEMRLQLKSNADERVANEATQKQLISNIAHDLKTPITAIKGYSEGLLDGVASSPQMQEEYIKTIYNKSVEMDNLIDELTFYSNLDAKKIPYNFQKVNVASYFREFTGDLSMDLSHQNAKLIYNKHINDDVDAIIDTEQLARVINNIITNSVKYRKPNEDLIIIFDVYEEGDFVRVDIIDNGIGIDEEDLPHIFDRLYRADRSRNKAAGGNGIGLSIVKTIIEDHGGKILATSTISRGTKMSFTLRKDKAQ